tara:strand:- start:2734 stop:3018 length:285 start_codon:yes stop_codon:yes gene_type:complete
MSEVIAQMEKEIYSSGVPLKHYIKTISTSPRDLIADLAKFIKLIDSGTQVQNLFYRIDINPAKKDGKLQYYEALATLAWNRVFQKVWFRRNFKG